METQDLIQIGIMGGTLISVLIALFSLRDASRNFKKQLKLQFFADYTKRYQDIMLNLPSIAYDESANIEDLPEEDRENLLKYMRAYFDLCSEQYYLNKVGHLEEEIWSEWSAGIKYLFGKQIFHQAWQKINQQKGYYPEFSQWITLELGK